MFYKTSERQNVRNSAETRAGLKVTPIGWEETREILLPKYDARDHWIIVAHLQAAPLITAIEQKYYLGEKNVDFTMITAFWRGQVYALIAAKKRWMQPYQLASLVRQMIGTKVSDRELATKDLYIPVPDPFIWDATDLATFLFDRRELAVAA